MFQARYAEDHVHVIPLSDALQQLSFIQACRQRGAKQISAGTWPRDAAEQPQVVRAVIEKTDYFFMNDLEAKAVFGSLESAHTEPGKVLYVTLGAQGACIIQGDTATLIPAVATTVLDPTGAGDTFCGATLAYLLQKKHLIMAARHAATLAAERSNTLVRLRFCLRIRPQRRLWTRVFKSMMGRCGKLPRSSQRSLKCLRFHSSARNTLLSDIPRRWIISSWPRCSSLAFGPSEITAMTSR